jgi:signal transduction histidine kinase
VVRLSAIAIGIVALALGMRTGLTSAAWVGRTFPGFVLLDNRVIASVGLGHWSGTAVGGLYQSQVIAVDGRPVASTAEVYALAARHSPGAPVRYRLRKGTDEREVSLAVQRFSARDWALLFVPFLLNGATWLTAGLVVWVLSPRTHLARALLAFCSATTLFVLTVPDLYGPATFFRLHVIGESLLPATALHLALFFPEPHPRAVWRLAGYAVSLVSLALYEAYLYQPAVYSTILFTNMVYLGLVGIFFGVRLVSEYRRGGSELARQRVRVIALGTLLGLGLPAMIVFVSVLMGGGTAMNPAAITPPLFALSLAYAVVKYDLFAIDAMVKRGAYYLLLTGAVGAAYVLAVVVFNLLLRAGAVTDSPAFPVFFTLAVLFLFNPLRTRLQAFVDRVFYRTRYDAAQLLASVGGRLASALQRDQIAGLVRECVEEAMPNGRTRLFVRDTRAGTLRESGGTTAVANPLGRALAGGRILTTFDPAELYGDPVTHEVVRTAMVALGAEVAVPLQLRGELVGALTAGPKRSGFFYTAGDAEFLRALAHQTAIALENARSYEALVELNARLEERVRERTAQLEAANHELGRAYGELKSAEAHLVQSEKMASLGRLVAGVAHEINNPVAFIANSIPPLRERLTQAATVASPEVSTLVLEAQELAGIIARGAERTATIVRDLRSFSRLGEAARKAADLHEGIEMSVRLLEPRWRDRIVIHREYGVLPVVECDSGQLNQVFMNVLANACDAIAGHGNVWVTTRAGEETITVTIRDDGAGMTPEVRERVFDPFYTTKDVGRGTGLGLAISHGIVAAHGGRIEVESTLGAGATFRIVLPTSAADGALDRAASGTR